MYAMDKTMEDTGQHWQQFNWVDLLIESTPAYQAVHKVFIWMLVVGEQGPSEIAECRFETLPETLHRDIHRIRDLRWDFKYLCILSSMILVLKNAIHGPRPALFQKATQLLLSSSLLPPLDELLPQSETQSFLSDVHRSAVYIQLRNCMDPSNVMHKLMYVLFLVPPPLLSLLIIITLFSHTHIQVQENGPCFENVHHAHQCAL